MPEPNEEEWRKGTRGKKRARCTLCGGKGYILRKNERKRAYTRQFDERAMDLFLEAYAMTGNITVSSEAAAIAPHTVRMKRDSDPEFSLRFDEAYDEFRSTLEVEGYRRAVEGVLEPVYQGGKLVGHKRAYSDGLLQTYLKAHHPKYKDKVAIEGSVTAGVLVVPGVMTSQRQWEKQFAAMETPVTYPNRPTAKPASSSPPPTRPTLKPPMMILMNSYLLYAAMGPQKVG